MARPLEVTRALEGSLRFGVLLALLALVACQALSAPSVLESGENGESVVVHLLDFELSSPYSVTVSTIETVALCQPRFSVASKTASELVSLLHTMKAGDFDGQFVRMKIDLPGGNLFYVDAEGGTLALPEGTETHLAENAFGRLKSLVRTASEFRSCYEGPLFKEAN